MIKKKKTQQTNNRKKLSVTKAIYENLTAKSYSMLKEKIFFKKNR